VLLGLLQRYKQQLAVEVDWPLDALPNRRRVGEPEGGQDLVAAVAGVHGERHRQRQTEWEGQVGGPILVDSQYLEQFRPGCLMTRQPVQPLGQFARRHLRAPHVEVEHVHEAHFALPQRRHIRGWRPG